MRLDGRTAWITGAASGIGRAAAQAFARAGAAVFLTDVQREAGETVAANLRAEGGRARFLSCDVSDEAEVAAAARHFAEEFGALHVLVTAAGVLEGAFQSVEALDVAVFRRVMEVNVLGTFLCCKHAAPLLERAGGGVVLCLASAGGVRGPSSSLAYGASKAAVHGFCQTLERQLSPRGTRVHVICPSAVDTPMKRRNLADGAAARGEAPESALAGVQLTHPAEIAAALLFLASDAAAAVQGTIFTR